eukprot:1450775-Lingulodinium_polyedra.AAC.1
MQASASGLAPSPPLFATPSAPSASLWRPRKQRQGQAWREGRGQEQACRATLGPSASSTSRWR